MPRKALVTWASTSVQNSQQVDPRGPSTTRLRRQGPRPSHATPSSRSTRTNKFLALKVSTVANWASISAYAPAIPTYLYATLYATYDARDLLRGEGRLPLHRAGGTPIAAPDVEAFLVVERIVEDGGA